MPYFAPCLITVQQIPETQFNLFLGMSVQPSIGTHVDI
uniref:Uncharacterized protein n=1 Tax=Rhizophora mucronata TaxID=61149 RepID=A0A2P2QER0_RHIMU